ncbi:hypothetical protein Y032_0235g3191 [Ancylostoma ceylanicum]|uniref:Uncharacterized protein n=1 Tax=Ancylostoma ceylanicum TaxID=53326 RepID=A0A016SEP6_9BILA|nr:hypothetical protein Y032_0235g3191 [Ancylostoma ceylanicum]
MESFGARLACGTCAARLTCNSGPAFSLSCSRTPFVKIKFRKQHKNAYLSLILTNGVLERLSMDARPLLKAGRAAGSARFYRLRIKTICTENFMYEDTS